MARSLARAIDYPDPEEVYFAGLLHNLGRWIWLAQLPEQYAAVIGNERDEAQTLAAERDLFGQTSIEMSASLMERWTRDGLISDAVLFQGESVDAVSDSPDLIRLLNLSRRLMGSEPWEEKSVFQDADELTGISASRLLEIRKEALADQQEIMRGYGFHTSREGFVVGGADVRRALNQHVHDTALVGSVNVYASDDAWLAAVQQFETLFGVSGLVAFEYLPKENVLRAGRFGSGVGSARLERMEVPVRPNRNLLAEACISRRAMSTLNAELPAFNSVLHTQLRRLFGKEELFALPVVSGDEVLGVIVAGLSREMLQDLLASDGILDYFLDVVARQLSAHARCEEERGRTGESQVQELVARTRRLIHEANNPLGVVANYLQILSLKFEQDHETRKQIGVIKEEINRVSDILATIRGVPKNNEDQRVAVDINKLLEEIVSIFRVSLFEPNGMDLDKNLPKVQSIPSHIKQVITNLLKNAVEALGSESKGTITVEINDAVYFDGRQCIRIVVADNGPGIAPNIIEHLFTSAISSKGAPHSGVGLVVVKGLVSELGGNVLVYSKQGEGARFELFP